MARIRSIKPEFWADFDTATNLSRDARLLYISLWNFCDEWARMAGDVRYVKGHCFPYDDDLGPEEIARLLEELAAVGNVVRYSVDQAPYLWLPNLAKHQRLEAHKVPSRLPEPPDHDPSGSRADESERGANSTERNSAQQVAGSRWQAAGSRDGAHASAPPQPVDNLPGELEVLRSKLEARKLTVRWDKLSPDQTAEIVALVEMHGDAPLVKAAVASFQPNNPPAFAQAWLKVWKSLPMPGGHLQAVPEPPCDRRGHTGTLRHCVQCAAEALAGDA